MSDKYTILFVCTGNTCRSPMAEGILKSLLKKKVLVNSEIISAGTSAATGFPATLYAIKAAKSHGVDISSHQSQPVTPLLIEKADLIYAMSSEHLTQLYRISNISQNKAFLLKKFLNTNIEDGNIADPIGQSLEKYNEIFLEIKEYLDKFIDEIVKRIDEKVNTK